MYIVASPVFTVAAAAAAAAATSSVLVSFLSLAGSILALTAIGAPATTVAVDDDQQHVLTTTANTSELYCKQTKAIHWLAIVSFLYKRAGRLS